VADINDDRRPQMINSYMAEVRAAALLCCCDVQTLLCCSKVHFRLRVLLHAEMKPSQI
jgi:hypothetical protein